jgi:hypothetical protein
MLAKTRPTCLKASRPLGEVFKTKKDRESILEFIRTTGIATRKRHVERGEGGGPI